MSVVAPKAEVNSWRCDVAADHRGLMALLET
jgi:hypothetical protein